MTNAIRKAAWFSLITNVVLFFLLIAGFEHDGFIRQFLRIAVPGLLLTTTTPDQVLGIILMVGANWVAWIGLWWLMIGTVREFRGSPAW